MPTSKHDSQLRYILKLTRFGVVKWRRPADHNETFTAARKDIFVATVWEDREPETQAQSAVQKRCVAHTCVNPNPEVCPRPSSAWRGLCPFFITNKCDGHHRHPISHARQW